MKFLDKIFLSLIIPLFLAGCSDIAELKLSEIEGEEFMIYFNVSAPISTTTRGESDIHSLTLYVFNSQGNEFYQKKDLTQADIESKTTSIFLTSSMKTGSLKIYAIANTPQGVSIPESPSTLEDLKGIVMEQRIDENELVFNGESEIIDPNGKTATLTLTRVTAKISIKTGSVSGYRVRGFQLRNAYAKGYLGATQIEGNKFTFYEPTGSEDFKTDINGNQDAPYVTNTLIYPSKGATDNDDPEGAFLIIAAEKDSEMNYYKVALKNEGNEYLNILANHHYEIEVKDITGRGAETPEDAVANPSNGYASVKIHDHVAEVLSMITDGVRELGTRETVTMTEETFPLIVKCFSPNENEYSSGGLSVEVVEGTDWLMATCTGEKIIDHSNSNGQDIDNPGKQYTYQLQLKDAGKIISRREAVVEVKWMGLKRLVTVYYNAEFKPEDAVKVDLYYWYLGKENSNNPPRTYVNNYWQAIKGSIKEIYGMDPASLADGKVRDEGLHFPMPYGEGENQWIYTYNLDFSPSQTGNNYIEDISISTKGDSFFAVENLDWKFELQGSLGTPKGTLRLKDPKPNDFTYATATITFTLKYEKGDVREINMDLYHTGFFDFDSGKTNLGLYYEVVKLGDAYWLDRNIGASSNMMLVDNIDFKIGKPDASGMFYKIMNVGSLSQPDPTPVFQEICPPGYSIPNSTDWDAVRLSTHFISKQLIENSNSYISTYFDTGNSKIGKIYFPKARYYNNSTELLAGYKVTDEVSAGDAGAGYYWTTTTAAGLEKDEIGKWLKVLNLSGASNTYINGSIKNHMMNVRCIAKFSQSSEEKHTISFNVRGATHVYLYSLDEKGNKSGIFTFPGKAIGSQSAVDALTSDDNSSYLHFSCTSTIPASDLYVLFAYVTKEGKITIISQNGDQTLEGATGWTVEIGANYFFDKNNGFTLDSRGIFKP